MLKDSAVKEYKNGEPPTYVICSGWWCAGDNSDNRKEFLGDEIIRGREFHKIWYSAIEKFSSPKKIFIVDSNSPVKPPINPNDPRIEFVSLDQNPGHSTNHPGKFCGYTRSILLGIEYALQCEVDYFVYVEQDALIYGNSIIERCIESMNSPYMFGSGEGVPQKLQQSFFIIDLGHAVRFVSRLRSIPYADGVISPEQKFSISASYGPIKLISFLEKHSKNSRFLSSVNRKLGKWLANYEWIPVGYGRRRPISFEDKLFYFQHGTKKEIDKFLELINNDYV